MSHSKNLVWYVKEESPGHFQRTAQFLYQLRERRDYRTCDVVIVLDDDEFDLLHSTIGCAHSNKLIKVVNSCKTPPVVYDMTRFPSEPVHKVIDWMYSGRMKIGIEHLADYLRVAADLGVVYLHRQMEETLRSAAMKGHVVKALNIATHAETGVTETTIVFVLNELCKRHEKKPLRWEDVLMFCMSSIMAMANVRLPQEKKVFLLNVLLMWLKLPGHMNYINGILGQLRLMEMSETDNHAFRMTLLSAMRNPNHRRNVFVSIINDRLAINIKSGKSSRLEDVESDVLTSRSNMSGGHNRSFTTSEMEDIRGIPDVFNENGRQRQRSFTNTEIEEIKRLPDVFDKEKQMKTKSEDSTISQGTTSSYGGTTSAMQTSDGSVLTERHWKYAQELGNQEKEDSSDEEQ